MQKRISCVDNIRATAITNSSIFNIGDSNQSNLSSRAIAVQKEGSLANIDLNFDDYPIFKRKAKWLDRKSDVVKKTIHHKHEICVKQMDVTGVSSSSVFQVGDMNHIQADSRIKHFRMLED